MEKNDIEIGIVIRMRDPYIFEPALRIIDINQGWITANNAEETTVTTTQSISIESLEFYELDRSLGIVHLVRYILRRLRFYIITKKDK